MHLSRKQDHVGATPTGGPIHHYLESINWYWSFGSRRLPQRCQCQIGDPRCQIFNSESPRSPTAEAPVSESGGWGCDSLRGYHFKAARSVAQLREEQPLYKRPVAGVMPAGSTAGRVAQLAEPSGLRPERHGCKSCLYDQIPNGVLTGQANRDRPLNESSQFEDEVQALSAPPIFHIPIV